MTKIQLSFASSIAGYTGKKMLWYLCVQKAKKIFYQPREAGWKVYKITVLFLFPDLQKKMRRRRIQTILTYVVAAVWLDDYDIVIDV